MTWLDAATRWRTWVDRDEPGRVAAYLDSLEEDGCTLNDDGRIDANTATPRCLDKMFWRNETYLFSSGAIFLWPSECLDAMHANIEDRMLRVFPFVSAVTSEYSANLPDKRKWINLVWNLSFSIYESALLKFRQPGDSLPIPVERFLGLAEELRLCCTDISGRNITCHMQDFPCVQFIVAEFRVAIGTPPLCPPGSLAHDLLPPPR